MVEPATTVAGAIPFTRTVGRKAYGEFADQMVERGLADVVGFAAEFGDYGVGGTGEHDGGRQLLIVEDPLGCFGQKIVAGYVDREGECSTGFDRRWGRWRRC